MADTKTQNINVTKNTAFANMLGGYNGEKEYNKRNTSWTIDSNNDGKKEVNWSKARQTFGDLLGDIAMFGIGALSGGLDDPVKGIGQGFQNVYARRNAMNAAANNYQNYLQQQAEKAAQDEQLRQAGIATHNFLKTSGLQGLPQNENDINPYTYSKDYLGQYIKELLPYQGTYNVVKDRNQIVGFNPPTNNAVPQKGVELQIQPPGTGEALPNVQPVNYLQGGVVENEPAYTPDRPMTLYNPATVAAYSGDYTSEQNNIRNNIQSDKNSQRSYAASMYGHNVSRQNALDRLAYEKEKQAEMLDLQKQAQELNEMKNIQNQFNNAIKMYQSAVDNGDKETANFYLQQANELSYYYPELSLGIGNGMPSIPVQKNVPVQAHSTNAF